MPTVNSYSKALELLFETSMIRDQGTSKLLEVNADGSIRTQKWYEKLGNLGARLIRSYDARKDTKDAAVAVALERMADRARNGADSPMDKIMAQKHDTYGYLRRFHEARERVEQRNAPRSAGVVPASSQQVRRDSVASLHTQGVANYGATSQVVAATTSATPATPSVRDTQEFKDRVAVLEQEFGAGDTHLYQNLIEMRMTEPEGPVAQSLSDAQYYAIKSYSNSAYSEMNAALRNPAGPEAQDPQVVRLNEYATSALRKLAQDGFSFSGITNRGVVNYDYFINLLPNQTYTASAFTSTSKRSDVARQMARTDTVSGTANDSTIIHTYGNTGVDIAPLSDNQYESEILYPPGSEFRVVFTGEHTTDIVQGDPGNPPVKKKVSYLVVEETNTSEKQGVSGIVSALDLAATTSRVIPTRAKPVSQSDSTGPLVGNQTFEDSGSQAIDIDGFDKR